MTNNERRVEVKKINDELHSTYFEKFRMYSKYDSQRHFPLKKQVIKKDTFVQIMKILEENLNRLAERRNILLTTYMVEFEIGKFENGLFNYFMKQENFDLATDCNIDTYKNTPDYKDEDVRQLYFEIGNLIHHTINARFEILNVKRVGKFQEYGRL